MYGWEDGFMHKDEGGTEPYNVDKLPPNVTAYAWNNVWEWGTGHRAYVLANKGYRVCYYSFFFLNISSNGCVKRNRIAKINL